MSSGAPSVVSPMFSPKRRPIISRDFGGRQVRKETVTIDAKVYTLAALTIAELREIASEIQKIKSLAPADAVDGCLCAFESFAKIAHASIQRANPSVELSLDGLCALVDAEELSEIISKAISISTPVTWPGMRSSRTQ